MASKTRRPPDHINFIFVSLFLLGGSQLMEMYTTPLAVFVRGILISLSFFSNSWALYIYDRDRKV